MLIALLEYIDLFNLSCRIIIYFEGGACALSFYIAIAILIIFILACRALYLLTCICSNFPIEFSPIIIAL